MALDVAGNSVLTVDCLDGLRANCSGADGCAGDRRILGAVLASLILHGLLMMLPTGQFSAMPEERPRDASMPTGERLEVFLGGAAPRPPEFLPMVAEMPNMAMASQTGEEEAAREEFPWAVTAPQSISQQTADYVSANDLDVHPSPDTPIVVPFPDSFQGSIKGRVILILSVRADGVIEQVSVDDSDLPNAFGQAASQTFLEARLRPGIKDGRPVAARMKILVEFEN